MAPVLAVCYNTLVLLFVASPQETSIWSLILQGLSLQQDRLGFSRWCCRIPKVKAKVISFLKA